MLKKILIPLFLLVILTSVVYSEPIPAVDGTLFLKHSITDELLADASVSINLINTKKGTNIRLQKFLQNGSLQHTFTSGDWEIILILQDKDSQKVTFFTKDELEIGTNPSFEKTIYLDPVGSLEGSVIDDQGNLVNNALLTFKCSKNLDIPFPNLTNKFGFFGVEIVPVGECQVTSSYKNVVGVEKVQIDHGKLSEIEIELNKKLLSESNLQRYILAGVLIILGILIWRFRLLEKIKRPKKKKQTKKSSKKSSKKTEVKIENINTHEAIEVSQPMTIIQTEEESLGETKTLNPRARDIMKTLNDREQKIINFLLENHHKSTQAKIRNGTGIPKTSLARAFMTLQSKKVLDIEAIGKLKKISFSDWFEGKE